MLRTITIIPALLALCQALLAGSGPKPFDPDEPFAHMAFSPDGARLALGRQDGAAIILIDMASGRRELIDAGPASGNFFAWSPDGRRLGYKTADGATQRAVVRDVLTGGESVVASGTLVGQVAWLGNSTLAVTEGRTLTVIRGEERKGFDIGLYVNQLAADPVGNKLAFCRGAELVILDPESGFQETMLRSDCDLFDPSFSPDGRRLAFRSVDGEAQALDLTNRKHHRLGPGLNPSWRDPITLLFTRKTHEDMALVKSELVAADLEVGAQEPLNVVVVRYPGMAAAGGGRLAAASLESGGLFTGRLDGAQVSALAPLDLGGLEKPRWGGFRGGAEARGLVPGWMPYIHQVYDTPDSFDGSAACGPTSCLMAVGYYHRYAVWNETVHVGANPPGTHLSPYGCYDSKVYAYGGHVFADTCSPPSGPPAHGAYGYCCTHGAGAWAYRCRDYVRLHGLSSDYDLSVTWEDVAAQIGDGCPLALSTAITAAGHLMCVRGYVDGYHTIVVNDPAGNRNNGPYWNYPGDTARYDWPGYNNGHVNINSASWMVTARGRHTRLALADYPDTVDAGHYFTVTFTDTTCVWQQDNDFTVDVCDGGSGAVAFTAGRSGLNDSNGGIWNVFNLTAPRTSSSVHFRSYLSPPGGTYDTRYISAWTDGSPTVVRPVSVRAALENPGFESGVAPWTDTENATLAWETLGHSGSRSLSIIPRVLTDYVPAVAHQDVQVVPGQQYALTGWARKNDGCGNSVRLAFMWFAAADTQIGSQVASPWLSTDDPQFRFLSTPAATAPAGAAYACLRLYVKAYGTAADQFDDLWFGDPSGAAGGPSLPAQAWEFRLMRCAPNPFSGATAVGFQLPGQGPASLRVYAVDGRLVRTLADGVLAAGPHLARWDGRDDRGGRAPAGVYLCRLEAGERRATARMTVLR